MSFKNFSTAQGDDKEAKTAKEVQGPNRPSEQPGKKSETVASAPKK